MRSKFSKQLLTLAALFVMLALLIACSGPAEPAGEAPAVDAPAASDETAADTDSTVPEGQYKESPMLTAQVAAGELPPVDERLPVEPLVIDVIEGIGEYGGIWEQAVTGQADANGASGYSHEPFVMFDDTCSQFQPNLAKAVEISDDGTEFTFTLREGHHWSDGELFTADDLVFWYEDVILNDELTPAKPTWLTSGGELGVVEKVDDFTVKFTFAQPHGFFLQTLAFVWGGHGGRVGLPAHYLEQFHADYADAAELQAKVDEAGFETWVELFQDKTASPALAYDLPSLRAWVLAEPGPPWVFERNPYYYKVDSEGNQLPYIDSVRLQSVEDKQMVTLKAVAGELGLQSRNVAFSDLPLYMQNREQGDYRVIKAMSEHPTGVTFFPNQNLVGDEVMRDLIRDIRFRQALNLAINRDEINELIYLGENLEISAVFPRLQDEPELFAHLTYDPDQAKALLDEIGLEVDSDGYRLRPDGEPLVINLDIFSGQQYVDGAQLVAQYWDAIGVRTSPEEISYDLWWPRVGSSEYPVTTYVKDSFGGLARYNYLRSYAPIDSSTYWAPAWGQWYQSSSQDGIEPPADSDARRAQELYDEAKITVDPARQLEILTEIERLDLKNAWEVLTVGPGPNIRIVKNNFHNVPEVNYCVLHDSDSWAEQYFIEQ